MATFSEKAKAVLDLGRVSNLPTVWTNCLAAFMIEKAFGYFPFPDPRGGGTVWTNPHDELTQLAYGAPALLAICLGASLLYLAGTTLNDAFDVEFDRQHRQERPIPSGIVGLPFVWTLGLLYLVGGAAVLWWFTPVEWPWLAGLVASILLYTVVHKKWSGSVIVMGLCRFFLYMAAATAAGSLFAQDIGRLVHTPVFWWSLALLSYIMGLSLLARGEATGGTPASWPLLLVFVPLVVWLGVSLDRVQPWSLVFVALFILWQWRTIRILRGTTPERIGKAVAGFLAGIVLFDSLVLSTELPFLAFLTALLMLPLTLLLQRKVAAT